MEGYTGFDVPVAVTDEQKEKENVCARLWNETVVSIQSVLDAHQELGFLEFHKKSNPSIAEMELSLLAIEGAFLGLQSHGDLTFKAWTDVNNCLQGIHLIRRLFEALRRGNKEEYDSCIRKLDTQRK
jgi:hypothetical protein